jgi:quinol monooxygenase YgiN
MLLALLCISSVAFAQAFKPKYLAQQENHRTEIIAPPSLVFIIHVDAMPQFTAPAIELLRNYRKNSLKDNGAKRVEVLQQVGHPNHFTIVEEWDNQASYDAHVSAPGTREFRTNLQPMLGAPFDERPHHTLD